jgi:hypothetical protein
MVEALAAWAAVLLFNFWWLWLPLLVVRSLTPRAGVRDSRGK